MCEQSEIDEINLKSTSYFKIRCDTVWLIFCKFLSAQELAVLCQCCPQECNSLNLSFRDWEQPLTAGNSLSKICAPCLRQVKKESRAVFNHALLVASHFLAQDEHEQLLRGIICYIHILHFQFSYNSHFIQCFLKCCHFVEGFHDATLELY